MLRTPHIVMLAMALLGFQAVSAQHRLSLQVEGVASSVGKLQIAVYSQKDSFLKMHGVFRNDSVPAEQGTTEVVFEGLPDGDYAVAIFHDKNDNEELDTNWIGIPQEPLGFSNARMRTFGPPSFEDCLIRLRSDTQVKVIME